MSVIQDKANAIAADMQQNQAVRHLAIDPFTIMAVVGVIIDLVKLYIQCKKTPQQTAASMQNPGVIERWRLHRVIRHHVDYPEAHAALGQPLFNSTLKVASTVTEDEVNGMYTEVQQQG